MVIYIGLAVITVALSCLVNNNYKVTSGVQIKITRQEMRNRILMVGIFTLLFCVSAARIAVGNDYWEYTNIFYLISANRDVATEIGFNLFVRLMQLFFGVGQTCYLLIFAVFAFGTIYLSLKALYEQSEFFTFAFFLFTACAYYLSGLNSVRYYFALAVALYAAKYAIKGDWIRFLLWILFASLFHKSVLVVIPVYWLATRNWKRRDGIIIGVVCLTFLVFQEYYRKLIFLFYPFYENSMFDTNDTSLVNIARSMGVLVFAILYYKYAIKGNKQNQFYFNLNIGALILYVFCSFIPEISRIGFYMNIFHIMLIPNIWITIPDKKQKRIFGVLIVLAFLLYFGLFLYKAGGEALRIVPYRNWIFQ